MNYSINDFRSVATMMVEPIEGHSWDRCSAIEVETTIYHINLDGDGIEDDTKVGTMKLLKVSKETNVVSVLDSISGDELIVGEALDGILNGDEDGRDDLFDDDVFNAGYRYVVTRFDVEPE